MSVEIEFDYSTIAASVDLCPRILREHMVRYQIFLLVRYLNFGFYSGIVTSDFGLFPWPNILAPSQQISNKRHGF